MQDYSDEYAFKVEVKRTSTFKVKPQAELIRTIKVTDVYDSKGYQHRYVVQQILDEVLAGLEKFDSKK